MGKLFKTWENEMQTRNQVSLIRKALYGVMSFGIIFSALSVGNLTSVRAQEGKTIFPPQNDQIQVPSQVQSDASSQALTLGAPGLSFRYVQTFGTAELPYLPDTIEGTHLNRPEGLFMDGSDNLYVTENNGYRMLRFDSSGDNTLVIGKAGMSYTDDYIFQNPADVAVDNDGNIWVVDNSRVVQYDPNSPNHIIKSVPAQADNPWQTGSQHGRFDNARGIAFGSSNGRMYVSDSNNNRVEVYDVSGSTPTIVDSIGKDGDGNDQLSSPQRIAAYGNNDLYVVDYGNKRIQHCTYGLEFWPCTTFDSGLSNPQGITVDGSNVYVTDADNGRIRKCATTDGSCNDFVTIPDAQPHDLAVDSSGNIYASTSWKDTVVEYTSSGALVGTYLGQNFVPYLTDDSHYNQPRVAIDSSNNIIILEEAGQRLIKMDSSGVVKWKVGVAGVDSNNDDAHFNWARGVAVDASGKIYVADKNRVQIFNGNGTFQNTIGGSWGTGNDQFKWATGIAVDNIGNIYVSDCENNRVQIYNSSRTYVTTLGAGQFNCPMGVSVDSARNIYVADGRNNRVQKFNSSLVLQMTLGTPGPGSEDFAHFGGQPEDVTVDAQGRIYVADTWNQRVQVFDTNGAYLTSIGDAWGSTSTSQFRNPSGVDVDSQGNVYMADTGNGRIQKFALGVPGWKQKNINGFGNRANDMVMALDVFNGQLYAGATNYTDGGQVWRTSNGNDWTAVSDPGFGSASSNRRVVYNLIEFKGQLYAGTGDWSSGTNGGQIWRCTLLCNSQSDWGLVEGNGFGNVNNSGIATFGVFNDTLYAATYNENVGGGTEIWRSTNGDAWSPVVTGGNGDVTNKDVVNFTLFNGSLYATTENTNGMEVWKTGDGGTWNRIATGGFGDTNNQNTGGMVVFGGKLYVSTGGGNVARVYRSTDGGTTWGQVGSDGFGDINNASVTALTVLNGVLYAAVTNQITGMEIWSSTNGTTWSQTNADGFGNSNNLQAVWASSTAVFNNSLYIGTYNWANGAGIWQKLNQIYLPLIKR
jgi:sugar lactone lactonase YvrE